MKTPCHLARHGRLWMALATCALGTMAHAQGYVGVQTLAQMRTQTTNTYVGLSTQPPNTCSAWGAHVRFDHTTANGKAWLASLLMAHASGRQIDIWYTNSGTPGTTDAACTSMAVLTGVRVR